jgi:vancomycin resistance protein VanJ
MRSLIRFLKTAYIVLAVLYLLVLALVFALASFLADPEWRGLARTALIFLLAPSVVLLPLALSLRRWRLALLMVLPVAGLALSFGPLFLPRSASAPDGVPRISVLTFNLHGYRTGLDSLAAIIKEGNADVVAVQELSTEAADYFESNLKDMYPYQSLHPQEIAYSGQGILSRYPLSEDEYWRSEQYSPTAGNMKVVLEVDGTSVTIFNAHPVPPFTTWRSLRPKPHSQQVAELLEKVRAEQGPVILLGDFNMTDQFEEYGQVTRLYTDTFREAGDVGLGFTFPSGKRPPIQPVLRLDYVFHNGYFRGLEARTLNWSGSSDHRPVWALLALVKR